MNGGDAAQLPEPIAEIVVDSESKKEAVDVQDRSQTLTDRRLPGWGAPDEAPAAEDEEVDISAERIRRALEERDVNIELRRDGGYDARCVFSFLKSLDITPLISVRIDSNTRAKSVNRARARAVLEQLGGVGGCTSRELARMTKSERRANQKKWREYVRFGLRWFVEIVISSFKRIFGESVKALLPRTAYIEVATKIFAYNRIQDIGGEAVRAVRTA